MMLLQLMNVYINEKDSLHVKKFYRFPFFYIEDVTLLLINHYATASYGD